MNLSILNNNVEVNQDNIVEYIQLLKEHQQECLNEGKLLDAELIKERIVDLQQHENEFKHLNLIEKNKKELMDLEEYTQNSFIEFNSEWDKKVDLVIQKVENQKSELFNQQEQDLKNFINECENQMIPKCKYSSDVQNNRHIFDKLIKTKRYKEAHEIRTLIQEKEIREEEAWVEKHRGKAKRQIDQFKQKQELDAEALLTKLTPQIELIEKERKKQMEKLLQKFQNMKQELENRQSSEISKLQLMNNKQSIGRTASHQNQSTILNKSQNQTFNQSMMNKSILNQSMGFANQSKLNNSQYILSNRQSQVNSATKIGKDSSRRIL